MPQRACVVERVGSPHMEGLSTLKLLVFCSAATSPMAAAIESALVPSVATILSAWTSCFGQTCFEIVGAMFVYLVTRVGGREEGAHGVAGEGCCFSRLTTTGDSSDGSDWDLFLAKAGKYEPGAVNVDGKRTELQVRPQRTERRTA